MTKGEKIIEDLHTKKAEIKEEKNHDRNIKLKTIGLTLLCVFVIEGAFFLGTLI